jgi:hypothetical protein
MRRLAVVLSLIGTFVIIVGLLFADFSGSQASDLSVEVENPAPAIIVEDAVDAVDSQSAGDEPVTVAQLPTPTQVDNACIDCHSDAELLQLVAEEEVVTESLNEGSG